MDGIGKIGSWIAAAGTSIATLYGGATFIDDRYAHVLALLDAREDIVLVEMRLEQKILSDRYAQLQQRQWKIEDRYGENLAQAPDMVKEEYRQIKSELASLTEELNRVNLEFKQRGVPSSRYYDQVGK